MTHFFETIQTYIQLLETAPEFLRVLSIAILTLLAAKIVQSVVIVVLQKATKHTQTNIDDEIVQILQGPLFYSVVFIGAASTIVISDVSSSVEFYVFAVLKTILILLWSTFIIRFLRILLARLATVSDRAKFIEPQTAPLLENVTVIIVAAAAIYLMFAVWGINMTAWLASAGIVGIAVGFAAKDSLANLFSGVFILADAPYKMGDYIVLDTGERGKVTDVGIRSTRILTRDDVEITVPNAVMSAAKIINESGGPGERYRFRVNLSVSYGSDIDLVEEVLLAVAHNEEQVCDSPHPRVRFVSFGASGLDFVLNCWIEKPEDRGLVRHLVNRAIYKSFAERGIEIPYTKHDVYIKEMPKN